MSKSSRISLNTLIESCIIVYKIATSELDYIETITLRWRIYLYKFSAPFRIRSSRLIWSLTLDLRDWSLPLAVEMSGSEPCKNIIDNVTNNYRAINKNRLYSPWVNQAQSRLGNGLMVCNTWISVCAELTTKQTLLF